MAWLLNLAANIFAEAPVDRVLEVTTDSYATRVIRARREGLILYDASSAQVRYEIVLQRPVGESSSKALSLCRIPSLEQADLRFTQMVDKIPTLVSITKDTSLAFLQRLCDAIRDHSSWNIAHLAVHLELENCLSDPRICDLFEAEDPFDGLSPLQLAVMLQNLKIIKTLLAKGAPVNHFDYKCDSVMHYAANTNKKIVSMITEKSKDTLNSKNGEGQTPLHVACIKDNRECVTALLAAGADVNISADSRDGGRGDYHPVGDPFQEFPGMFSHEDIKSGGTPLHWACSQEVIEALIEKSCNMNCLNFQHQTALHMMVLRGRFDCLVCLLSHGADTTVRDDNGNTALRLAVQKCDVNAVKALIVFNANLDETDESKHSLRHGVPCGSNPGDEVLYVLHSVGVKRCEPGVRGCSPGCSAAEIYNGCAPPLSVNSPSRDTLNLILEESTLPKSDSHKGRLLCLDGGGIRGIIMVVMLAEIEKAVGKPIHHCFDWIAGTSTGGIIALAIASGKTLSECLSLYFKLKSKVFVGSRPYASEPFEDILKSTFGENTTMADIEFPKIMICATLADRQPVDLHLFRNYPSPNDILNIPAVSSPWPTPEPAPLQRLWQAARATGAAPTYFSAADRFIDGGLISNNPTLDAMTEIHEYNSVLNVMGRHAEVTPLSVVVSLGTGSAPKTENEEALSFLRRGGNIYNLLNLALGLVNARAGAQIITMIIDQATQADGRVVDRARAWCSSIGVPFTRFSPQLSKDVALNETKNDVLVNMMYETRAYMHSRKDVLANLVYILKQPLAMPPKCN